MAAFDHALALEKGEHAGDDHLQELRDLDVRQRGQRVKRARSAFGRHEHSIERERVEVCVQPQVTRATLHDGDRSALAAANAELAVRAPIEPEHRVDEDDPWKPPAGDATHGAEQLLAVGKPRPERERHGESERGAHVGNVCMTLIYTAELHGENPFGYLVALFEHEAGVAAAPADWLPWTYRGTLAALATKRARAA
jgi:hypothetical protein